MNYPDPGGKATAGWPLWERALFVGAVYTAPWAAVVRGARLYASAPALHAIGLAAVLAVLVLVFVAGLLVTARYAPQRRWALALWALEVAPVLGGVVLVGVVLWSIRQNRRRSLAVN